MTIADRLRGLLTRARGRRSEQTSISCEEALAALHEFLDGELVGDDHERVKAHFDMCAQCFPKLRVEESFRLAVRRAARGEKAPASLRERLSAALSDARQDAEDPG